MKNQENFLIEKDDFEKKILDVIGDIELSMRELSDPEKKEEIQDHLIKTTEEYLNKFGKQLEGDYTNDLREISRKNPEILVRKVVPENLFKTLDAKSKYSVEFKEHQNLNNKGYSNAAVLGNDLGGLTVAHLEGLGKIKTGALSLIVGFNPGDMKVDELEKDELESIKGEFRRYYRKISGSTEFENIKFIIARYPRSIFPEELMTEREQENENQKYISRIHEI